jgi:MFS family permease
MKEVPSGMVSGLLVGVSHGALVGMSAVYAKRIGLSEVGAARFIFCAYVGTVVTQLPLGWIYDHFPRRGVLVGVSGLCAALAVAAIPSPRTGPLAYALIFAIGALAFPLYGLANAYLNDWIPEESRAAASAGYVLIVAVGAMAGPVLAALTMRRVGSGGFFVVQAAANGLVAAFVGGRVLRDRRARHADRGAATFRATS